MQRFRVSPADWCKNCGIFGKRTKFDTELENYLVSVSHFFGNIVLLNDFIEGLDGELQISVVS